jgi:predicted nucleic acid-binding protein
LTSEVLEAELLKDTDAVRRERAVKLNSQATENIVLNEKSFRRAADLELLGYGAFDAMHLAAAEQAGGERLLTTDDRFIRQAGRALGNPTVAVRNPVNWIKEFKP